MVTVVAKQDLEPGDVLQRFQAEANQHEPSGGNEKFGYIACVLHFPRLCAVFVPL